MKIAQVIDHTLLRPDAGPTEIEKVCQEALEYGFASVCVGPAWVRFASSRLRGSPVKMCTVVGFPLGSSTTKTKVFEAEDAIKNGAEELDAVINIGALKSGDVGFVENEIREISRVGAFLKIIIEAGLLTRREKVKACIASRDAGADFVKTSTGFGSGGATAEDVALMRSTVGEEMGVKASGGIRNLGSALEMLEAGATRIGTSTGVDIVREGHNG
jgi:deoxyribose-phosphate aldolase